MSQVLDKGFVKLIDSMPAQPQPEEIWDGSWGPADARVVEAARVSFKSKSKGLEADKKLLTYLLKNGHGSPFEHVTFAFHVKLPIFVARQLMKYRAGHSVNEVSGRYTELDEDYYVPELSRMQGQGTGNKQGSGEELSAAGKLYCVDEIAFVAHTAFARYLELLRMGLSRELARMVLPLNTYTEIHWSMNLRGLMHVLAQRDHEHAQWETREYAKALRVEALAIAPFTLSL